MNGERNMAFIHYLGERHSQLPTDSAEDPFFLVSLGVA